MADRRNQGRESTPDTGVPPARPRDDLRTAAHASHGDQRDDLHGRCHPAPRPTDDPSTAPESGTRD